MSRLTTTEARLVEQYVSVLDYVSRCAQAIDHGDWFYLHDKAGYLADQAQRLSRDRPRGLRRASPAARAGGAGGGGLVRPPLPGGSAAAPRPAQGAPVIAPPAPRRPAPGGGLAVLVVVTVLAALAAPHATTLRGLIADALPAIAAPTPPGARPAPGSRAARAVAFALGQRGKPYRWGAEGPGAYRLLGLDLGGLASRRGDHSPDRCRPARRPRSCPWPPPARRLGDLPQPRPLGAACGDGGRPGPDGRGPGPRHPGPLDQHPRWLAGGRPTRGRPMRPPRSWTSSAGMG